MEQISRKKPHYPVSPAFGKYLARHGRNISLPVSYDMLRDFRESVVLYDSQGRDTLWETVFHPPSVTEELHRGLKRTYSLLKSTGYTQAEEHLQVERIDFCVFGNSKPFRIRIVNTYNEVHDYFYVKVADASRIWGLELEHLLSPYRINYLVDGRTLIEEHIAGVPGDVFAAGYMDRREFNPRRIAKEFVKFNERCFMRLLGDMRSYNFVFDISTDFDDIQFRIRAIDFDQQSYEGRKNVYLPQFFKENGSRSSTAASAASTTGSATCSGPSRRSPSPSPGRSTGLEMNWPSTTVATASSNVPPCRSCCTCTSSAS